MPELPEVETVRRGLQPAMQDQKIVRAEVNRPDLRWRFPSDMAQRLTGARVVRLWGVQSTSFWTWIVRRL